MEIVKCQESQGKRQGTGFLPEIIDESVQLLHSILLRENTFNLRTLNCLFLPKPVRSIIGASLQFAICRRGEMKGISVYDGSQFFYDGPQFLLSKDFSMS